MKEKKKISLEEIKQRLADFSFDSFEQFNNAKTDEAFSPYIASAAVLAYYNPESIKPTKKITAAKKDKDLIHELIGNSEIFVDPLNSQENEKIKKEYKVIYSLKPEIRRQAIQRLIKEKTLSSAIEANHKIIMESNRPLQKILTQVLLNDKIKIPQLSIEEVKALYKVTDWLGGLKEFKLPSKDQIMSDLVMMEMLAPFKHLTGSYINGKFVERFRGRHLELRRLREYVGVAPPLGFMEKIGRFIDDLSPFSTSEKDPLMIFGVGGVGKSTLVSKFILEHFEAHQHDKFPFVYLDFDKANIDAHRPGTLLIEAARQLSIQYTDIKDLSEEFVVFQKRWTIEYENYGYDEEDSMMLKLSSRNTLSENIERRLRIQSQFLGLMEKLSSKISRPFLMVLDTFEEVQYKGDNFVNEVFDFLRSLQLKYAKIRIVIVGRAPVINQETVPIELGDLDPEAAVGYLLGIGVKNEKEAEKIAELAGGNPLTLKLCAEIVSKKGTAELTSINLKSNKGSTQSNPVTELEIQGILYERILKHIHNPLVRQLAHPGMVLRRITPEVIVEVLSGPCQLKIKSKSTAGELFREISREVALVTCTEPGVLKHRSDVRKVMLKLIMNSDKKNLALKIHKLAVEYYSGKKGIVNRSEEVYHRLAMGESPRTVEGKWMKGMEKFLLGSRDELPEKAQAFLLGKTGMASLDKSILEKADIEDQHRIIAKEAADLLNSGLAESAIDVIDRAFGSSNYILSLIKARAFVQLNKRAEARHCAKTAISSYYSDLIPVSALEELNKYASGDIEKGSMDDYEDFTTFI